MHPREFFRDCWREVPFHLPAVDSQQLEKLRIRSERKQRKRGATWFIFGGVLIATAVAIYFAWPKGGKARLASSSNSTSSTNSTTTSSNIVVSGSATDAVLTVSGYIIARERIEISPRFLGVVKWIGVKKGDAVTNGQVVVQLDDAEYKARLLESEGRVASAEASLDRARLDFERVTQLARTDIESKKAQDDARTQLEGARADVKQAEGA